MITSTANPRIKRLAGLQKKRRMREEEQVFLTEGLRMFREAPPEMLRELYISESFAKKEKELICRKEQEARIQAEILADHVFSHVSDTKTPQGVLCVMARRKEPSAEEMFDLQAGGKPPLLMVLDNLQDPGNLGTILRTGEGAGVTGVVMSSDCVDLYNPKTVRSTMGSVYRVPCRREDDMERFLHKMKEAGIRIYAAHLKGTADYDEEDYTGGSAFLIGNEGNGLKEETARMADTYIRIPMEGEVESLNAAIAATILMFEAGRQRRRK